MPGDSSAPSASVGGRPLAGAAATNAGGLPVSPAWWPVPRRSVLLPLALAPPLALSAPLTKFYDLRADPVNSLDGKPFWGARFPACFPPICRLGCPGH